MTITTAIIGAGSLGLGFCLGLIVGFNLASCQCRRIVGDVLGEAND